MLKLFKKLSLYAVVVIPIEQPQNFLNLKYSDLKPNQVTLSKDVKISVNKTASPLFYKLDKVQSHKSLSVTGVVKITKNLASEDKDTYFQLGVIYAGDYRPNYFTRKFLPEWLLKIIDIDKSRGVGHIDFLHVSAPGKKELSKESSLSDVKMSFKTVTRLNEDNSFSFSAKLRDEKIIGLWLRADSDDSSGIFTTNITSLKFID